MKDYSGKFMTDLSFEEIQEVKDILSKLPMDVIVTIENEDEQYDFKEFTYELEEEFFDVPDEDYNKIVGKCFMNQSKTQMLKVLSLSVGLSPNRAKYDKAYEFIYEEFDRYNDNKFYPLDYIWLQETAEDDDNYKPYCLSDTCELNIAKEGMYHLGKDGNLYVDVDCGGTYDKFTEISAEEFEQLSKEA